LAQVLPTKFVNRPKSIWSTARLFSLYVAPAIAALNDRTKIP